MLNQLRKSVEWPALDKEEIVFYGNVVFISVYFELEIQISSDNWLYLSFLVAYRFPVRFLGSKFRST